MSSLPSSLIAIETFWCLRDALHSPALGLCTCCFFCQEHCSLPAWPLGLFLVSFSPLNHHPPPLLLPSLCPFVYTVPISFVFSTVCPLLRLSPLGGQALYSCCHCWVFHLRDNAVSICPVTATFPDAHSPVPGTCLSPHGSLGHDPGVQ